MSHPMSSGLTRKVQQAEAQFHPAYYPGGGWSPPHPAPRGPENRYGIPTRGWNRRPRLLPLTGIPRRRSRA